MRKFLAGFFCCYLLVALVSGLAMRVAVPALNGLGTAYAGLTWPVNMTCIAAWHTTCAVAPDPELAAWMFTLPDPE